MGIRRWLIGAITISFIASGNSVEKKEAHGSTVDDSSVRTWTATFGGTEGDGGYSVTPAVDGGYVIAGGTNSFNAIFQDVYLIKVDSDGHKEWERTIPGPGGANALSGESADCVLQSEDQGYVVAGTTVSFADASSEGSIDVYVIGIDRIGEVLWRRLAGGVGSDDAHCVIRAPSGGYLIAGSTTSFHAGDEEMYVLRTDATGLTQWQRSYEGKGFEECASVLAAQDGGYVLVGRTSPSYPDLEQTDVYMVKIDSVGKKMWSRTFGGADADYATSATLARSGGYVVVGGTASFGAGGIDVYVIRTDEKGNKLWERTFGGAQGEFANSVVATSDGGYVVAGETSSFGAGKMDAYLLKADSMGNKMWERTFGGADDEMAKSVIAAEDGGYVVAGYTESFGHGLDVYVIKTDAEGRVKE